MGRRRDRLDKRLANQIATRQKNSVKKHEESARRDRQMKELLKKGSFPYTPGILSWASVKLNKKAAEITEEDIKTLIYTASD